MMGPSDLTAATTQRLTTVTPVWTTDVRSSPSWFDPAVEGTISGEVSVLARGLSVEQHSERVLVLLRGERDAPAL